MFVRILLVNSVFKISNQQHTSGLFARIVHKISLIIFYFKRTSQFPHYELGNGEANANSILVDIVYNFEVLKHLTRHLLLSKANSLVSYLYLKHFRIVYLYLHYFHFYGAFVWKLDSVWKDVYQHMLQSDSVLVYNCVNLWFMLVIYLELKALLLALVVEKLV